MTVDGPEDLLFMGSGSTTHSPAATSINSLQQTIEGIRVADFNWGSPSAKPVVLRFRAWATVSLVISVAVRNAANDRSYVTNVTLGVTAADYVVTIPGDTTGTWPTDTAAAMIVSFTVMAGSNFITASPSTWVAGNYRATTGVGNLFASANQTFYLCNVGLHLDPNNTGVPPPWQMPDEAEELRACQRYYTKMTMNLAATANATAWVHATSYPYPVQMRTTPTLSTAGDGSVSNVTAAAFDSASGVWSCRHYIQSTAAGPYQILARTGTANARM